MGWPIAHSRSPRLHSWWLHQHGIDGAYVPLAVRPEDLTAAVKALSVLGFRGCNVTLPHKERALALVDHIDPFAQRIGAVNTIVVAEDGSLFGSNTDGFGFIEALKASAPNWRASAAPAVVIGAGGAARSVVATLLDAGTPHVVIVNRTRARAEALAEEIGGLIHTVDWHERDAALTDAGLLVNTTSLGMHGQSALELSLQQLPPTAVVTDAVYVPLTTVLLRDAGARGNQVVDGLGMLLHQARPGFEAWFGVAPEVTSELRMHVLQSFSDEIA